MAEVVKEPCERAVYGPELVNLQACLWVQAVVVVDLALGWGLLVPSSKNRHLSLTFHWRVEEAVGVMNLWHCYLTGYRC